MGISKAIYTTSLTIIKSILKSRTEDDIEKDLIDHFAGIISDSGTVDAISNKISDIVKTYRKTPFLPVTLPSLPMPFLASLKNKSSPWFSSTTEKDETVLLKHCGIFQ